MIDDILAGLEEDGFSAENIIFGMGGALLQGVNRDTFKFALKTSAVCINGVWKEVSKSPVGDQSKKSKGGKFTVLKEMYGYRTIPYDEILEDKNILTEVFCDGVVTKEYNWEEITERVDNQFHK